MLLYNDVPRNLRSLDQKKFKIKYKAHLLDYLSTLNQ
jgi:hypothetical protein